MHRIWIILAALLVIAGMAQAQVAAPRLNPVDPEADKPINPATLAYSGPSRVGLGLFFDLESEDTIGGTTTTRAEGEGKFLVQGRYVGEMFAVGVESDTVDLDFPVGSSINPLGVPLTGELKNQMVNLSILLFESIAIGYGNIVNEFSIDSPLGSFTQKETLPLLGVSWMVAENIFLGAAAGTETVENISGPISVELDRDVQRFGVGYRGRDGENGFHLEVYQEAVDAIDDTLVSGNTEDEEETAGITIEVVFFDILIGAEKLSTDFTDAVNGTAAGEEDATAVTLGYAPMEGLAFVVTATNIETTQPNGDTENVDTTFVGITYQF